MAYTKHVQGHWLFDLPAIDMLYKVKKQKLFWDSRGQSRYSKSYPQTITLGSGNMEQQKLAAVFGGVLYVALNSDASESEARL